MKTRERIALGILLASIGAIRAIHPNQPIVENYVGRQIPTAMVARNLDRGCGFLHPQLDTAPLPNLFLVEPPLYAQLVASSRHLIGLDLEPTGRLISALATTLGAWGLFGLVRRREGLAIAFVALASFGLFPVMIRYGRAFQPDALMIGCVLAGLRGWDEYEDSGDWRWALLGGFVLAVGLAVKVTVAWALIPFVLILKRWPIGWRLIIAGVLLIPTAAWYLHAWHELTQSGSGSLANADSTSIWLKVLFSTEAWVRLATYQSIGRGLLIRSFTPVGFVLGFYGLVATGKLDRLWVGWSVGCLLSIVGLASKWHHAYYWMVVAPLAAVGVARGLVHLAKWARFGRPLALGLGSILLALCVYQSASTFRTPVEWASLIEATDKLKALTQVEQRVVAAEAVLYYADLKGYRLEHNPAAARRAAGEWDLKSFGYDGTFDGDPLELVDFYQMVHSSTFVIFDHPFFNRFGSPELPTAPASPMLVADVGSVEHEPRRRAWREAIRNRHGRKILFDQPGYLIVELP